MSPNRRQQDHGTDQSNPGELDQIGHLLRPRRGRAQALQFRLHRGDLRRQMVEGRQILRHPQPLGQRELQCRPPAPLLGRKQLTRWWDEIIAMDEAPEAVAAHGPPTPPPLAVGDERPQVAHMLWRHPDLGHEVSTQELGEDQDIMFVGLHPCGRNLLDLGGMGNDHPSNEWLELVRMTPVLIRTGAREGGGLRD